METDTSESLFWKKNRLFELFRFPASTSHPAETLANFMYETI